MAHNFNTIQGTEVVNTNDSIQGSHAVTLNNIKSFVSEEDVIILNTVTPSFLPADDKNPLLSEVVDWVTTNLTNDQRKNGTQIVYYDPNSGSDANHPDFIWTLNTDLSVTLSNKRAYNTKTIYVDSESGSDLTGKRGYREFPFKTLNVAILSLQDGDLLKVFPGDYISNISSDRIFHIDCDNGVNWQYTVPLTSARTLSVPTTVSWNFDKLFTTVTNIGVTINPNFLSGCNFGINLIIKKAEYVYLINSGSSKNFYSQYWNIVNSFESHFTPSSLNNVQTNPIVSLQLDNIYKTTDLWNVGCQLSNNSTYYVNLNSIQWESNQSLNSHFFGRYFGSDSNTNNKTIYFNCKNIRSRSLVPLNSYPIFTDVVTAQLSGTATFSNTVLRVNTMSNGDNVGFNVEGDFDTHTIGHGFHGAQRYDNLYRYNLKGRNRKGFGFFTTQHSASNNNQIYLDIDLISDDHAGVYIGLDGSTLNTDALIVITGRIKVTRAGFPCIVLGANQNNRVILKDLTLINDGTVSPIMINSVTPENIQIQNVTSNSLVTDPNILEVGQSIIRNTNYK